MNLGLHEPDTAELCRDAKGHRNLRAERLLDEKERLSRRLGWAIRKGDTRKAQHLERRLADWSATCVRRRRATPGRSTANETDAAAPPELLPRQSKML